MEQAPDNSRERWKVCKHGVEIRDCARSFFAPYCICCWEWLGTRVSDLCATCEHEGPT